MIDWAKDLLHDVSQLIIPANRLWDAQCFTKPTKERTQQIIVLLKQARQKIDSILEELEE